jgi:hypothetical protein
MAETSTHPADGTHPDPLPYRDGVLSLARRVGLRCRTIAIAAAVLGSVPVLTGCSTDEVSSRASDARSSAARVADAAGNLHSREVCLAVRDDLDTLRSLAGRLADDPSLRVPLAGQVTAAVRRLTDKIGASAPEWRAVLDGAGDLGQAMRDTNEANVRLTASQAALAIRVAQAGCAVATR